MFRTPSLPTLHVKEINATAMAHLLAIGREDIGAAALLFDTHPEIVQRLLELDESGLPPSERVGKIETLTESNAALFKIGVGARYMSSAAHGPIVGDLCSVGGPYERYRVQIQQLNRFLMRSLDRITRQRGAPVIALDMPVDVADALVQTSDQEVVHIEENAARPLVRLRLTHSVLDQIFLFNKKEVIEPSLATWVLLCNASRREVEDLPATEILVDTQEPPLRVGRRADAPYSKEASDLVQTIAELGGNVKTACRLLGATANNLGLRRILSEYQDSRFCGDSSCNDNRITQLMSTAIALLALRLQRAGHSFGESHVMAFFYYRHCLAPGNQYVINFNDYVDKIVAPLRRAGIWLAHSEQFEAAYLVVDEGTRCDVVPPHHGLASSGRIGRARSAGRRRHTRSAKAQQSVS